MSIGDQYFILVVYAGLMQEWRSQKDGLNWRLFTATRSFIKPNRLYAKFHACLHCPFTIFS